MFENNTTSEIVAIYNQHATKPVNRFSSRAVAIARTEALLATTVETPVAAPVETPVETPIAAPVAVEPVLVAAAGSTARTRYLVSADHEIAKYGCVDAVAAIGYNTHDGTFYASIRGYGCSKDYATPEAAIRGMLADHACTNIRIRPAGGMAVAAPVEPIREMLVESLAAPVETPVETPIEPKRSARKKAAELAVAAIAAETAPAPAVVVVEPVVVVAPAEAAEPTKKPRKAAPAAKFPGKTIELTGKKLELFELMRKPDGTNHDEACLALGWARCAATISRVVRAAEDAGFAVRKWKADGATRYAVGG